jgi:hypothetical protein
MMPLDIRANGDACPCAMTPLYESIFKYESLILQFIEYIFYSGGMSSIAPEHLPITQPTGPATRSARSGPFTPDQQATAAAELKQAAPRWAALLAECAGMALGYGEHQVDAARYRQIADLCAAAGVDQSLIEAWIEVGRQRATTAAALTHKACVLS